MPSVRVGSRFSGRWSLFESLHSLPWPFIKSENYWPKGQILGKIRVLLSNGQSMFSDVLRDMIQIQPDMEVVGEIPEPLELLVAVAETGAEVVVMPVHENREPGICSHLLSEYPSLLLITVSHDFKRAVLFKQIITREVITKATKEDVLLLIRRARA